MPNATDTSLFYLWHLESIGLVTRNAQDEPLLPEAWLKGLPEVKVAIIDSGCAATHPNLPAAALTPALDVAVDPRGVVYGAEDAAAIHAAWRGLSAKLKELGVGPLEGELKSIVQQMEASPPNIMTVEDPASQFAAHGTACAGLIAGRTLRKKPSDAVLNYFGVNPFATIIPVATSYNHEIAPLTRALLHAVAMGADVILLPRAVNDLEHVGSAVSIGDLRRSRFTDVNEPTRKKLADDKADFEKLLALLAPRLPIILAAGNDGLGVISYPASLAALGKAPELKDLVVVGAANSNGRRSSYSSGRSSDGVAVFAPSDDEERIDVLGTWFDPSDATGKQIAALGLEDSRAYSSFGVLAIDVPGRLAAPDGSADDALLTRHYYRIFGGTSAASAIVAGLASLLEAIGRKSGKPRLSGHEFRELLRVQPNAGLAKAAADAAAATVPDLPADDSVTVIDAATLLRRR